MRICSIFDLRAELFSVTFDLTGRNFPVFPGKIDLGIALAHFELSAAELGLDPVIRLEDPAFAAEDLSYIASCSIKTASE